MNLYTSESLFESKSPCIQAKLLVNIYESEKGSLRPMSNQQTLANVHGHGESTRGKR